MSTVTKDHLAKRILVKSTDLTKTEILEARVLEFSSNGTLAKLHIRNGTMWTQVNSFEVLDVMPELSLIDELQAALQLAKQENAKLIADRVEIEAGIVKLNEQMAQGAKGVELLTKQVQAFATENTQLKEANVELGKAVFQLKETLRITQAAAAKPTEPVPAPAS